MMKFDFNSLKQVMVVYSIIKNNHEKSINSTLNFKVALGGITPGTPLAPYAFSGGIIKSDTYPFDIFETPSSHP